jgi:hypothetical protein
LLCKIEVVVFSLCCFVKLALGMLFSLCNVIISI